MNHDADYARGMWRTCKECGDSYTDYEVHRRLHNIDRPSPDHMTMTEVAKALNRPRRTIVDWVKKKKLRSEEYIRGNNRIWVTKKALRDLVEGEMRDDFRTVIAWGATGRL